MASPRAEPCPAALGMCALGQAQDAVQPHQVSGTLPISGLAVAAVAVRAAKAWPLSH